MSFCEAAAAACGEKTSVSGVSGHSERDTVAFILRTE